MLKLSNSTIFIGILALFVIKIAPTFCEDKCTSSDSDLADECRKIAFLLDCSAGSNETTTTTMAPTTSTMEGTTTQNEESSSTSTTTDQSSTSTSSSTPSSTSPSTNSPNQTEPCPCVLIIELIRLKYAILNETQQDSFDICLDQIRDVLVENGTITSVEHKVAQIASILRSCFATNPDIKSRLKFEQIANYGQIYEIISMGNKFANNFVDLEGLIAVKNATGSCNLTDTLVQAMANDSCGNGSSALIQDLADQLNQVFAKGQANYGKSRKLSYLQKLVQKKFFVENPNFQNCVKNVSIPNFGNFHQFLNLAEQYEISTSLGSTYLNGSAANCSLLQSLIDALNSLSNNSSVNQTILDEAQEFVKNLIDYFNGTEAIEERLAFLVGQFGNLSGECKNLVEQIQMNSTESFYLNIDLSDVIIIAEFCSFANNSVCGNLTDSRLPSASWPETCAVDPISNNSDIEKAMAKYAANLTSIQRQQFNSYKNSITNCVHNQTTSNGEGEEKNEGKLKCVKNYIQGYANSLENGQPALRGKFLGVEVITVLVENATNVVFGAIGDICECNNN